MIKLSKAEALNYLEKGYVVIIRNKDFEDYPVIKQGNIFVDMMIQLKVN